DFSQFAVGLFFQAEDGIRVRNVTGVQTCALPILIKLLTDLLDDVLTYSYADPPADMSHMWKQQINIEDPDYTGYRHEVKETLVDAIASSTDYLITEGSITVQDAGTLFGSHNWAIFQRLSALLYSRQE